ncbi:MAG: putative transport system permease protein [Abditibacteriota bacterium]|nr:putative transport system permease protein [Abditibacteriota bacterium]
MNYLLRFLSLRYWLRHRGGFALAALGVTMGVAVFVSMQVANHSVLAAFGASLDAVSGKANLQIRGGQNGLDERFYAALKRQSDARIRAMAPLVSSTLFSPSLKLKPGDEGTSLLMMGIDVFAEVDFRDIDWQSASGSTQTVAPDTSTRGARSSSSKDDGQNAARPVWQFLLEPDAIAISQTLAQKYGLKEGSRLDIFVGAKRKALRVVAILRDGELNNAFGGDFALLDIASAQEAFEHVGRLSQIDLIVDEADVETVASELRQRLPADATVQRPAQRGAQVADLLGAFQLNLSALSCITLFVGAFLIYNTIAIAVVRRRSEAATLRSFGTSGSLLTRMFLIEAAGIGLFGSLLGLGVGILLAHFTLGAVAHTVSTLYLAVKAEQLFVPDWLWWGAPLGGTVLSVLAAWPAATEAAHTSPRAALQNVSLHQTITRFSPAMFGGGLAMLALAWLLSQPFAAGRAVWMGFIATFCTLSGFALLCPLLTLWGGRLVQVWGGKYFGVETLLAGSYLQRALNRSSLVIAALMVSLAMTIGLSIMVRSFRDTVSEWVSSTISADIFIAPARGFSGEKGPGLPPEVVRYVQTLDAVTSLDSIRGTATQIGKQPVYIAANVLPSLQSGARRLRWVETERGSEHALRDFHESRAILISERFRNLLGFKAGSRVPLLTPQGRVEFQVAGVFYDYTPNQCVLYMPQSLYRKYWQDFGIDGLALYLKPGASAKTVIEELQSRFSRQYQLTLLPNREIRQSVFKTFDDTFAITYALQLIAVIVAAIGIFDTLIALLLERSRELATLRATGASPGQIMRLTLIEFGLIGFFAWAIGAVAGIALAWQLIFVINRQFFGWTIHASLPPQVLLQALGLALAAAIGAGIGPAWAAARRSIAPALQTE